MASPRGSPRMESMWEIWIAAGATALFVAQIEILRRITVAEGVAWRFAARSGTVPLGLTEA